MGKGALLMDTVTTFIKWGTTRTFKAATLVLFVMLYFVVLADTGAGSAKRKRNELTEEQKKS